MKTAYIELTGKKGLAVSDISSKVRDISDQDDGARSSLGLKPMELDTPEPMHKNVDLAAPATPVTDAGQHMSTPSYGWMTAVTVLLIAMWLIGSSAVLYGFFDLGTNMSNPPKTPKPQNPFRADLL